MVLRVAGGVAWRIGCRFCNCTSDLVSGSGLSGMVISATIIFSDGRIACGTSYSVVRDTFWNCDQLHSVAYLEFVKTNLSHHYAPHAMASDFVRDVLTRTIDKSWAQKLRRLYVEPKLRLTICVVLGLFAVVVTV